MFNCLHTERSQTPTVSTQLLTKYTFTNLCMVTNTILQLFIFKNIDSRQS